MLELTNDDWNRPLTEVIPGLAEFVRDATGNKDPVYTTHWNKVTPWALAAQLSGVSTSGWPVFDMLYQYEAAVDKQSVTDPVATYGFPLRTLVS